MDDLIVAGVAVPFVVAVVCIAVCLVFSQKKDAQLSARSPGTMSYKWGYFLGYSGLGISLWPNIIPPDISIRAAAGPSQSLGFALVGALLIIPLILMYTAWGYWVFRGKVRRGDGYH